MPVELLQKLSCQALPTPVSDTESIDKLRVLYAAGHVLVQLPSLSDQHPVAHVLSITEMGRKALLDLKSSSG